MIVLRTLLGHTDFTDLTDFYVPQSFCCPAEFLLSRRNKGNHRNYDRPPDSLRSHRFHGSHRFLCPAEFFVVPQSFCCPAEIKEIKEVFRFALCAQPVPEALSVISFISAGQKNSAELKIQCAACAEGTFCDFSDFCVPLKNL